MRTIEDHLRAYVDQIESDQRPVSAEDALAFVETVRVQGSGTRLLPERNRRQGILIAASIAVAVLLLLGSTFLLRARVDGTEIGTASTTTAPAPSQSIETHLGTWVWEKSQVPVGWSVVEYDGLFYSTQSDPIVDRDLEPVSPQSRDPENWLLTSSDGVSWDRTLLPDEMRGHRVFLRPTDDGLIIFGISEIGLPPTCWRSIDGATWTPSQCPMAGTQGLDLTLPDIEVEGVEARVQTFNDPVLAGATRLVLGNLYFEFPDFVNEILQSEYHSDLEGGDSGTFQVIDGDTGSITHEIDYVIEGTSIEYTFWDGRSSSGTVIHTARIDMGSTDLMNQVDRAGGPLGPSLNLLWRSPSAGEPFEVVDDPFVSDAGPRSNRRDGILYLTSIGDTFVAYGAVVGGATTRVNEFVTRNEPSYIGAVATSSDGMTWDITEIPELVDPNGVIEELPDGRVLWDAQSGFWVSDDRITGKVLAHPEGEPMFVQSVENGLIVMGGSGALLKISRDGLEWSTVPLPERRENGTSGLGFLRDIVFYSVTPDGGETTSWVGHLEP